MTKKMKIAAVAVGAVVLVGGVFYGGMKYGQSSFGGKAGGFGSGLNQTSIERQVRSRMQTGGGFVNGEVLSKDDKSITIKLNNGGSRIILLSGTTKVMKDSEGAIGDVAVGSNVMITGAVNADGSMNAQSIQIRPVGAPMPGANNSPQVKK
ncbi:MAG: hypothetical protein UT33_C0015G0014 [Candidatus Peregrinibacteria bacterium GW2011_GWC2_39_14]|nr:MAG: hypothetical protein US92_C0007G0014 [Candidatus Peregrinibacteria bacterium GW2011_GWA2_38_36]KKR04957.1 MAG: hypothetical protein UT33_C0015G0014 [Candidatus Peregrinibacteria bacterium GW2011_GWC2_39_14]